MPLLSLAPPPFFTALCLGHLPPPPLVSKISVPCSGSQNVLLRSSSSSFVRFCFEGLEFGLSSVEG
jgi:hypothetical protein